MFRSTKHAAAVLILGLLGGCGAPGVPLPEPDRVATDDRFDIYVVSAAADAPAGAEVGDIDGDGDLDLVVNFYGDRGPDPGPIDFPPGGITIFTNGGSLDRWTPRPVLTRDDGQYFPHQARPVDIDRDEDLDLLVAAGFFVCEFNPEVGPCGSLFWLEQHGDQWLRHDIVADGSAAFYHRGELADLDGDGTDDLVTVGEHQADANGQWFRGTGSGWESTPHDMGQFGGSLPVVHDVDGDGDLDMASGEFFFEGASFAWLENLAAPTAENPSGRWRRHEITADLGRTIQLSVIPDLFGDGRDRWVGSNHVNTASGDPTPRSGIYLLKPGDDPRQPWAHRMISTDIESRPTVGLAFQAAPGVFSWGDVDGDGDIDLTVSGDGDDRVFWLEQTEPGNFVQHTLLTGFGQAAGGTIADLDGDGTHEVIFTSYDTGEVLIFRYRG